jgi:quinone-modifying oxidoreductase subunit QmoA
MVGVVATTETILVVGGGISGMTTALEAAECGKQVVLVEKNPTLGGRVALLYRYFPKLCHPACGLEINLRRIKAARGLRVLTMAEVVKVSGTRGDYVVTIRIAPRYVNANCTACGECANAVSAEVGDPASYGLAKTKAAYLPHAMAYPERYVLDPSIIGSADADKAKAACKYGAIDLSMREESVQLKVGTIVWATGWKPYDATKIQPYGYGRFRNVITSLEFERLADPHGPTAGKLLRPSDGRQAKDIAFIQCAGSRDENHLRHCSRICCMATLKHACYVREASGEAARTSIYYIDIRSIDRLEDFYQRVQRDPTVTFIKSKVASIEMDERSQDLILHGVDTQGYHRYANHHDLVVLAIGMEPSVSASRLSGHLIEDSSGFMEGSDDEGMFGAGCATGALDVNRSVQSATAAALRAIQVINATSRAEVLA